MTLILDHCKTRGLSEYVTFCTVLTAFSESDFKVKAKQLMQDGIHYTYGIYQQSDRETNGVRWWPGDLSDIRHNVDLFVDAFLTRVGDRPVFPDGAQIVADCYRVQQWNSPDPKKGMEAFLASKETQNYYGRLSNVPTLISTRKTF